MPRTGLRLSAALDELDNPPRNIIRRIPARFCLENRVFNFGVRPHHGKVVLDAGVFKSERDGVNPVTLIFTAFLGFESPAQKIQGSAGKRLVWRGKELGETFPVRRRVAPQII